MRHGMCVPAGLMLLVVVVNAFAQPQGGARGGRGFGFFTGSHTTMLTMSAVRTEIGITAEQSRKIDALRAEPREKERSALGGGREELAGLSEEERERRLASFRESRREIYEAADEKLRTILGEAQWERLSQIRFQQEGARAMARPDVAEQVGLSQEQRDRILKLAEETRSARRGEGWESFVERWQKANDEIVALLDDGQKAKWNEMKGKEFAFPEAREASSRGQ